MDVHELLDACRMRVADLEEQVDLIHKQRNLWRQLMDTLSETNESNASLECVYHYSCMYVVWQAMAVRRTIREGHNEYVWARVLSDLEMRAPDITLDAVLHDQGRSMAPRATPAGERSWLLHEWFDNSGHFRTEVLQADQAALDAAAKHIIEQTDRSIAHLYPHTANHPPAANGELDSSMATLTRITGRYRRLITGEAGDPSIFELDFEWTTLSEAPFLASAWLAEPERLR